LICRIVGTKSVLIPGGGDIADVESISYGWNRNVVQRILLGFSIKGSDLVLAESECSAREVVAIASPTNMKLVYLSVDTDLFSPHGAKEPIVLTVSRVIDGGNIVRKGLRTFKEVARLLPDYNFLVVGEASGGSCDELAHGASGNLRFLGLVSSEELVSLMRRATVYAQLSKHESFGVATVEAMACGCVPVVTVEGSLPEVAGECGLYADYGNADQTSMAIESAFENRESLGKRARARVLNLFDDHRREKGLIDSLEELETAE
jgi:glycosyltransferase involved in cell wall biosynthesis